MGRMGRRNLVYVFGIQKTSEGHVRIQVSPVVMGKTDVLNLRNMVIGHCMFVVRCLFFLCSTHPN